MYLLDAKFDKETGISFAKVHHLGHVWFGAARLNEGDIASSYAGCRFAHLRAEKAALEYELSLACADYKEAQKFMKSVISDKRYDASCPTAKVMERQLYVRKRKCEKLKEQIKNKEEELEVAIHNQDKIMKNIRKKQEEKALEQGE